MSLDSSGKKALTRRSILSIAGGAAGLLTANKIVGSEAPRLVVQVPATPGAAAAETPTAANTAVTPVVPFDTRPEFVEQTLPEANQSVLELFSPLKAGSKVYDWTIVAIHGVHLGAVPVIMEDKTGDRFQVDVCLKDNASGAPHAVASTSRLSFFLANSGDGSTPSDEVHGLGAIALATLLSRRESGGTPEGLLTLRQRMASFPDGGYAIPV